MSDIPRIFKSALDRMRMHKAAAVPQTVSARYNLGAPVKDIDGSNRFGYDPKDVDVYSMGTWNDHRFGRFLFDDPNKTPEQNQADWDKFFKARMDARRRYNNAHGITETSVNGGEPIPVLALEQAPWYWRLTGQGYKSFSPATPVYLKIPRKGSTADKRKARLHGSGYAEHPGYHTDGRLNVVTQTYKTEVGRRHLLGTTIHEGNHIESYPVDLETPESYIDIVRNPFQRLLVMQLGSGAPDLNDNAQYSNRNLMEKVRSNFALKAYAHKLTGKVVNKHDDWLKEMAAHGFITRDKDGRWIYTDKLAKHPLFNEVQNGRNDIQTKLDFYNSREQYERDVKDGNVKPDNAIETMFRKQDYLMEGAFNGQPYRRVYGSVIGSVLPS